MQSKRYFKHSASQRQYVTKRPILLLGALCILLLLLVLLFSCMHSTGISGGAANNKTTLCDCIGALSALCFVRMYVVCVFNIILLHHHHFTVDT